VASASGFVLPDRVARTVEIGAAPLVCRDIAEIACDGAPVSLAPSALARIVAGHTTLEALAARGDAIYGVSTGLGAAVDTAIVVEGQERQVRVGLARSVGAGPLAAPELVRATMAARLAGLVQGRSGAAPQTVQALASMLNHRLHPTMRLLGSTGEADLAPLAHIATVLMGAGEAEFDGEILPGGEALARAGLQVPRLGLKDGLALVSSNAASVGQGALVVQDCARVLEAAFAAAALSCAGFGANLSPLDARLAQLRAAPGQGVAARRLLALLAGTQGMGRRLQDPLSLRCLAPVIGCADVALARARDAVELELNGAGDNPAILAEDMAALANANFDVTHLALAFEGLGLALSRLAALAGARMIQLMSPANSGLPRFLSPLQGGRSGFSPVLKTVAALVAGIQHAAMPMPTVVLPAAEGVEDYATMAPAVVAKTATIVEQLRLLVAIEMLVAAQACDLRGSVLSPSMAAIHGAVRHLVAPLNEDRALSPDIAALESLIRTSDDWAI
jgi:histidine ammonia-lyase